MTLLNYWHYISFAVILLIFIVGIISSLKQKTTKIMSAMIFTTFLISILLTVFSVIIVDKYTKKVGLYKVKSKRLLSTEQIIYTGIVKNEGDFPIGKVKFEIKLVNKGHAIGNVKGGDFYQTSDFLGLFSSSKKGSAGSAPESKPQTITKTFVVAKKLQPGTAQSFRVYFKFPGYFRSVSFFTKVKGR